MEDREADSMLMYHPREDTDFHQLYKRLHSTTQEKDIIHTQMKSYMQEKNKTKLKR